MTLGGPASAVASANGGAAVPNSLLAGHCSEYSGRMAELMYSCLHHALMFLLSSSPQLGENETTSSQAGGGGGSAYSSNLGPMWPRPRDLMALQDQCMAVLYSMADVPRGAGGGAEGGGRRKHICQGVLKVGVGLFTLSCSILL